MQDEIYRDDQAAKLSAGKMRMPLARAQLSAR